MSDDSINPKPDPPESLHATYPDENPNPGDTSSIISQGFRMTINELAREGIAFRLMGLSLFVAAVGASMQLIPTTFDNRQNAATDKLLPQTPGISFTPADGSSLLLLVSHVTLFVAFLLCVTGILSLFLRLRRRYL